MRTKFSPVAFLVALRVQGAFKKVGVITLVKNRHDWHFSQDYGYVTDAEAGSIGEQIKFLLAETAAIDVDFTVSGQAFRVSRIQESPDDAARRASEPAGPAQWIHVIEYVELADSLKQAGEMLQGLRSQDSFLAGRAYSTENKEAKPAKMQAFFRDDGSLSNAEIAQQDGHARRLTRASSLRAMALRVGAVVNIARVGTL